MKTFKTKIYKDHTDRLVKISISTSAFRNQGKTGLIKETRKYIKSSVKLKEFAEALRKNRYDAYLDLNTSKLCKALRKHNCRWGTARKGLNIFFRDVLYNSFFFKELKLCFEYGDQLEIPLDSKTMGKIRRLYVENNFKQFELVKPRTTTIIALDSENSRSFQKIAAEIAKRLPKYRSYRRVDLDMEFWTEEIGK